MKDEELKKEMLKAQDGAEKLAEVMYKALCSEFPKGLSRLTVTTGLVYLAHLLSDVQAEVGGGSVTQNFLEISECMQKYYMALRIREGMKLDKRPVTEQDEGGEGDEGSGD